MTMANQQTTAPADVLPLATCISWGLGTLTVAALFNSVNVLLLRYIVDYAGLGAVLAGSLIGLSKLYDAVIDPAVGSWSDRTRSSMGRRRPFILGGGLLLAISALLLFNIPGTLSNDGKASFVIFALLVYASGYAAFSVPYMAMPAEMTTSFHERSRLISFRVTGVAIASLIATFVGPVLIARSGGGQSGHTTLSIFLAVVIVAGTIGCFWGTRGAPFHYDESPVRLSLMRKLALMADNRPFVLLLVIKLLQLTALAVTQASMPFLFKRVLGLSDTLLGVYFLIFYGVMIVLQPLWVRAARLWGKRSVYLIATIAYALLYLSWYWLTPGEPLVLVYGRAVLFGAFGGAVLLLGQSLLPDTMEWDYRRTGMRREGMLSAVYTMVEKLSFALGAAATGIVLGRAGYIQGTGNAAVVQPQSAIAAIYMLASTLPMMLLLASCVALWFYSLTEQQLVGAPTPDAGDPGIAGEVAA